MDISSQDIKLTFIEQSVKAYAHSVVIAMAQTIRKKKVIDTTALINSLTYTSTGTDKGAIGKLLFKEYGRFIDMGVSKGHRLGQGAKALDNAIKSTQQRKPKKIYSPIAYGKLNGLIGDLMYGLTEQTIESIKNQLQNASTTI